MTREPDNTRKNDESKSKLSEALDKSMFRKPTKAEMMEAMESVTALETVRKKDGTVVKRPVTWPE
jgi:hypothetical protein